MIGFYIVLTIAVLFVAFMGGVIGYLIGKYWKKKQRMDIDKVKSMLKQAKNAMLKYNATFEDRYRTRAFNLILDAERELSKQNSL